MDNGAHSTYIQPLISFLMHGYPYVVQTGFEDDSSKLWIVVHGESEYNQSGRIGGDSKLTSIGEQFAKSLSEWVVSSLTGDSQSSFYILSSELKRSTDTAKYIINHIKSHSHIKNSVTWISTKELNEISAGVLFPSPFSLLLMGYQKGLRWYDI